MTDSSPQNSRRPEENTLCSSEWLWPLLIVAGGACCALTSRTFWIDECVTAEFANHPTLAESWRAMRGYPEMQLPFYMLYMWAWANLAGTGEWVLRLAGLPWFLAGAGVFLAALGRRADGRWLLALVVGWSPFAWYYLNEARVYASQLGLALALVGALVQLRTGMERGEWSRGWWRAALWIWFLISGTSVLGAMWGFFFVMGFLLTAPRTEWRRLARLAPWSLAAVLAGLAGLASYYAWTLGAKPAPGATTAQTIVFVGYELLGAAGLGPGRNDLRAGGAAVLRPFLLPLGLFACVVATVLWQGAQELWSRLGTRRYLLLAGCVATPLLFLCVLGWVTHFRVLGRHATPLLAVLLPVLALGLARLARGRWPGRGLAGAYLLLVLLSCLSLRLAARHEKDDFRSASFAARAAAAEGKTVWWNANKFGADYYHVALETNLTRPAPIWLVIKRTPEELRGLAPPDFIIMSKPDLYDEAGAVGAYAQEHGFRVVRRWPMITLLARTPE